MMSLIFDISHKIGYNRRYKGKKSLLNLLLRFCVVNDVEIVDEMFISDNL